MYKEDLALNNLQELICHKNQPIKNSSLLHILCNVVSKFKSYIGELISRCLKVFEYRKVLHNRTASWSGRIGKKTKSSLVPLSCGEAVLEKVHKDEDDMMTSSQHKKRNKSDKSSQKNSVHFQLLGRSASKIRKYLVIFLSQWRKIYCLPNHSPLPNTKVAGCSLTPKFKQWLVLNSLQTKWPFRKFQMLGTVSYTYHKRFFGSDISSWSQSWPPSSLVWPLHYNKIFLVHFGLVVMMH